MSHSRDIDNAFFPCLEAVADAVLARPHDLLAVMFSESGLLANAWNDNPKSLPPEKRYNASGINQMMPATLVGLGWTRGHAAFRALSATEQLAWVERYFHPYRGRLVSIGAVYTANFLPAQLSRAVDPNFVLTAKGGPYGYAYAPNATFDVNHNLQITVGELETAVLRNCQGPRWAELLARLDGTEVNDEQIEVVDLGTTRGVQTALARLGHDPGTIDGIPGRKTSAAVLAFQCERGLKPDGIYGPLTRNAISRALAALVTAEPNK
jgi:hypothetical protein